MELPTRTLGPLRHMTVAPAPARLLAEAPCDQQGAKVKPQMRARKSDRRMTKTQEVLPGPVWWLRAAPLGT